MIRTIVSIFITLGLIITLSVYEMCYVHNTFEYFHGLLQSLYDKTQLQTVTDEDGNALRSYWKEEKKHLHVWIPHTALQEIDYQMNEAIGFIYQDNYDDALPKIKVLIGLSEDIPRSYKLNWGNIF
ncbi:MAG: DUF4363 family protein [Clostridia bacterium]|nr:DUF4363 family protein [Clostridia bacterium]